jgi:hypothetical protein
MSTHRGRGGRATSSESGTSRQHEGHEGDIFFVPFVVHELFHRIQPELGLITLSGQNAHLDTFEGRVWLRLEWRALARALGQAGEDRNRTVGDALAFRMARRSQFADAAENERVDEIREGLAQYTGTVATAASRPEAIASAIEQMAAAERHETFLQQSYTTGVAYAMLLDLAADAAACKYLVPPQLKPGR